jgi:D-alanyl-D-alanine carboxypeptidase
MSSSKDLYQQFNDILHRVNSRKGIKHVVMAVESGDGALNWKGAAGEASPDGTPMQTETPYFIASIDKLFNAVLVMQLAESGRLHLDERISTYLPPIFIDGLHRLEGRDHSDRITIRHLLSHTSGLPDWLEDSPRDGESVVETITRQGDRAFTLEDTIGLVRERLTPHFPPQDPAASRPRLRYSDTNYMLLIAIIEAVTARPLHEVLHDRVVPAPGASSHLPAGSLETTRPLPRARDTQRPRRAAGNSAADTIVPRGI